MDLPRDNRVVHDWLVRLVSEVRLVTFSEVWSRPLLHFTEFLLSGSDLDSSVNTVGSQRASALLVPLLKHLLLDLWIAANEVIERLDIGLGTIHGEGQVVVLEVAAYTWQVDQRLHTSPAQLLGVTKARALEDEWGAHGTSAQDNLLSGPEDTANRFTTVEGLGRDCDDTHSSTVFNDDLLHLGVALEVEVIVFGSGAMDIGVSRITSSS